MSNVEKAARKELRLLKHKPEELRLVENKTQASVVAKHLLKKIFPKAKLNGTVELHPISRDELNTSFFTDFLEDRDTEFERKSFLYTVPHDDLQAYAKRHKLKLRKLQLDDKEKEVHDLLADLQDEQTMPALRKTFEWMKQAVKKKK